MMVVLLWLGFRKLGTHASVGDADPANWPGQLSEPQIEAVKAEIVRLVEQANVEAQIHWASFAAGTAISVGILATIGSVEGTHATANVLRAVLSAMGLIVALANLCWTERIGAYNHSRWMVAGVLLDELKRKVNGNSISALSTIVEYGRQLTNEHRVSINNKQLRVPIWGRISGRTLIRVVSCAWVIVFAVITAATIAGAVGGRRNEGADTAGPRGADSVGKAEVVAVRAQRLFSIT
jgi:hypothetical protein